MIAQLEQSGYDFENLKQEIDSAFQRRKRDEGKPIPPPGLYGEVLQS